MVRYMGSKKRKSTYREGTINGEKRRLTKRERQQQEYQSLVKMLIGCIVVLVLVFVLNAVITSNFTFNGIYYEEPDDNEVIEVVGSSDNGEEERVSLHLNGKLTVKVEVGSKYKEPGYVATSNIKGNISENVIVTGEVDTNTVGTYELTYTLSYRGINPKLKRLVKVVEKKTSSDKNDKPKEEDKPPVENPSKPNSGSNSNTTPAPSNPGNGGNTQPPVVKPQGNITLKLNGDATIYLTEGSSYSDKGASAVDTNGTDVSSKISVSGQVNTNVPGTYKITYSITNYNGEVLSVVRNVIVQAMGITLKLDNSNPTNQAVNILVTTNVDNFDRLMLPNGTKVPNKTYTYRVTTNGTYEFVVFNTAGVSRKGTMVVSNIDKDKPKGKCEITHGNNESYITITASDVSGIGKYTYSGNEYTSNVITINHRLATGIQINVGFYDRAGNFGNANCLVP